MALGRGGEVFLIDAQNTYLGRICPWKECAPGIRLRYDALHCGQRAYVHDDPEAIQLKSSLIAAPPLVLWPEVQARIAMPRDIEQGLIAVLATQNGNRMHCYLRNWPVIYLRGAILQLLRSKIT
jgi:hypothetical protein